MGVHITKNPLSPEEKEKLLKPHRALVISASIILLIGILTSGIFYPDFPQGIRIFLSAVFIMTVLILSVGIITFYRLKKVKFKFTATGIITDMKFHTKRNHEGSWKIENDRIRLKVDTPSQKYSFDHPVDTKRRIHGRLLIIMEDQTFYAEVPAFCKARTGKKMEIDFIDRPGLKYVLDVRNSD